jgi:2-oxoglutarate ferredoxin oxidoreductase subunit beta
MPGGGKPKGPVLNHRQLSSAEYGGRPSTLCKGCGHDAISSAVARALWENAENPYKIAKMSGIGCSSKTTAYWLSRSWGFNSVHGRMPSVTTGAVVANRELNAVGVSGDGDSASIGMGQFVHVVRRNLPMTYVIANNGVYGLTKGQFSATADRGSKSKKGDTNEFEAIDLCGLALELGCTFVARSYSADRKQLIPMLRAALDHKGTAIVDIISPCVTFNNHAGSTKSYDWGKENEQPIHEIGYVNHWELEEVEYGAGEGIDVTLPDGGLIQFSKLDHDHDPRDLEAAKALLADAKAKQKFLTGIFYIDENRPNLHDEIDMVDTPLSQLPQSVTRPGPEMLEAVMDSFK